jgi:dipeptide transport system ATP-binding protein
MPSTPACGDSAAFLPGAPLLDVADLRVEFGPVEQPLAAVDGLDLTVAAGEVVGLVGESGSGKTVTALAVMGLIEAPGRVRAARLAFAGRDLPSLPAPQRRALLGKDMAMIFQDPASSLNPCFTVRFQLVEAIRAHGKKGRGGRSPTALRARARLLLSKVDLPDPERRLDAYPHQLSGGMSQRVMIAMALAGDPRLLIADEPTTALDVTVQAQVLELLRQLQRERGMALLLITHDLGVVAQMAQRVVVIYAGQEMERGPVAEVLARPRHPYTAALLAALPERAAGRRLAALPGTVPGLADRPPGCLFAPRCPFATARCHGERPQLRGEAAARVRCHFPLDAAGRPTGQGDPGNPAVGARKAAS